MSSALFDDESASSADDTSYKSESKKPAIPLVEYHEDDDDEEYDAAQDGIIGTAAAEKSTSTKLLPQKSSASSASSKHMIVLEAPPRFDTVDTAADAAAKVFMTKLPNVVGIQPTAFDMDTYSAKQEERDYKGFVHNMIRWKYKTNANDSITPLRDAKGNLVRESNTHLVTWQDDTVTPPRICYTLHIGTNEILELDSHDTSTKNTVFAGSNGYLYLSQRAQFVDNSDTNGATTDGGTVLECVAAISSKLSARPSSLQSQAHQHLTVAVRQKTIKKALIAEYVTQDDPEKAKEEKMKTKSDFQKATTMRKKSQNYSNKRSNRRGFNDDDDDEDDGNYDSININKLKRRKNNRDNGDQDDSEDYGDSSSSSEEENYKSRLAAMKKKKETKDDSEEDLVFGGGGDDDDDSDEEVVNRAKKSAKKLTSVLDDESEDEE